MSETAPDPRMRRRDLLRLAAAGAAALGLPTHAWGARATEARTLAFHHTHTGESARIVYFSDGIYLPEGLAEVDHILRDHYSGEVHPIERGLLDLLFRLGEALETREPFHVISGYRSPATNERLAQRSSGVARRSLHMSGQAIDVRVPGCDLARVRRAALALRAGGVGFYPRPDFVHVDVGRIRWW